MDVRPAAAILPLHEYEQAGTRVVSEIRFMPERAVRRHSGERALPHPQWYDTLLA
jgi:hypothetical protein